MEPLLPFSSDLRGQLTNAVELAQALGFELKQAQEDISELQRWPRPGAILPGWDGEGTDLSVLGPAVEDHCGMKWFPVLLDDEEDPTMMKAASIEILERSK